MARPSDEQILQAAQDLQAHLGEPRCLFIAGALPLIGLAYADTKTRDEYVQQLYMWGVFPYENGEYQCTERQRVSAYNMASAQSSCGITTRRVWRYAGVDAPQIYDFYGNDNRLGSAVRYEISFAQSVGAWVSGTPWVEGTDFPREGDASVIGCSSCGPSYVRGGIFGGEHEFTTVCWLDGLMHSVDGGQPGIALRTRALVEVWTGEDKDGRRTGELWAGAVDANGNCPMGADGRPATGRRYVGFSSAALLPLRGTSPGCGEGADDSEGYSDEGGGSGSTAKKVLTGLGLGALGIAAGWGVPRLVKAIKKRKGSGMWPFLAASAILPGI